MTVQQIINLALASTHTKTGQVAAATLLSFFNIIRHDLGNMIIKDVDENYFFQIWKLDAETLAETGRANNEYLFPEASSTTPGLLKLLKLTLKTDEDDVYHKVAKEVDIKTLEHDWAYYLDNQPRSNPIYFIADESYFVAPKWATDNLPESPSGNLQIKLYGIAKLVDLAADALESTILIPSDQHHMIALGMEQYIYKARGKSKAALTAAQEYEAKKQDMIDDMTNRDNSAMQASLPDDTNLQYGE